MAKGLRIGLLGFGNIGVGVIGALQRKRDLLDARCPRPLELLRVSDVDLDRPRPVKLDRALLTTDSESVVRDPEIDVIVELIGGIEPARTLVATALNEGKHVVTANKALLAAHGAELLGLASEKGVRLLFEAAVGGGIPVVRVLCESLAADRITRIHGVLNGTCNYILTQMSEADVPFDEALAAAQELGYAEADPSADIEGIDAANKIAILASMAFGCDIRLADVYREGIAHLTQHDLRAAQENGYVIKHRAAAELGEDRRVAISVRPTLLRAENPLASVAGVLNGVVIEGALVGSVFLTGPGAGPLPTASAVLSDLVALSAVEDGRSPPAPFLSVEVGRKADISSECACDGYWLRIATDGSPEALAEAARSLSARSIPIRRIVERSGASEEPAGRCMVEVFTAETALENVRAAAEAIAAAERSGPHGSILLLPRID